MVGGQLVPGRGDVARGGVRDLITTGGAAASTAPVSFGGTSIMWTDLPGRSQRAGTRHSVLVAEAVQRDGRHRTDGGRAVEHATGWRVFEDAVVLVDVARPVAPAPAGGFRAAGSWEHRGAVTRLASGPPRRRRGVVPVADDLAPGGTPGGAVADAGAPEAWAFLPAAVRTDAERLVPTPTTWLGELTQEMPHGFPLGQSIRTLRMSPERAVVVLATRALTPIPGAGIEAHVVQMARVPWVVEQVGLDLGDMTERVPITRR